ncbi:HlyD family secretion protein [Paracraurococcus lichenis]|uniref:HlyD family secretion protein n=1 Tax=Paracraurococcus lichenis TaxID=3064888 RepID=A0ABT9E329_9PROT|nr:HlyD family secretion protein [Paracraurococcus sp. LOR1-02]MDO9710561.1 HlyD family secretion protein [Paracraurococcus sp. LOR1-02]
MPPRSFLLFLLGVTAVVGAAMLVLGTRSALNRRDDPVTVDAYVDGDRTPLASHLPAYVRRVPVADNQPVRRGDLIVELVDDDYVAARDQARANLVAADAAIRSLQEQQGVVEQVIEQARAAVLAIEAGMPAIANELQRQRTLLPTLAGTRRSFEAAEADQMRSLATHAQAQAQLALRERQRAVLAAQLDQARARQAAAAAELRLAELNLGWTRITAPIDGRLGARQVREGSLVAPGTVVGTVTPLEGVWVSANFTERQITDIRPGARAEVRVDSFGRTAIPARVAGIAPATGAQFSLVPADNSTGNFTKVVQRVPVKLALDLAGTGLTGRVAPGMSARAQVFTRAAAEAGP